MQQRKTLVWIHQYLKVTAMQLSRKLCRTSLQHTYQIQGSLCPIQCKRPAVPHSQPVKASCLAAHRANTMLHEQAWQKEFVSSLEEMVCVSLHAGASHRGTPPERAHRPLAAAQAAGSFEEPVPGRNPCPAGVHTQAHRQAVGRAAAARDTCRRAADKPGGLPGQRFND